MAPLRFSANVSWLFPELSGLPARLRAAGSAGFEAAEVAWPYADPPEALACAVREAGLQEIERRGKWDWGPFPGGRRPSERGWSRLCCTPRL
ncbi:putative hydroxypyruvate isomerase (putative) [Phyllostomus discolor]|uniref:Putative hydroxypyruvate isomerase (Putative) n=1 Tax=Phyllostomus discolor TaxID=89673 RepID=A0A834E9U6_9CHIR|nr:putative hydroxypyruvate isomerase (putative) [Phyllostomus discolor]